MLVSFSSPAQKDGWDFFGECADFRACGIGSGNEACFDHRVF